MALYTNMARAVRSLNPEAAYVRAFDNRVSAVRYLRVSVRLRNLDESWNGIAKLRGLNPEVASMGWSGLLS